MNSKLYSHFLVPILGISLSFLEPCASSSQKGPPKPGAGDIVYEVATVTPAFKDVPVKVTSVGKFVASDKVAVHAGQSGVIEKVNIDEGNRVVVGDPLCVFRNEEVNNKIERKQAELKEAEATLEHSQKMQELEGISPTLANNQEEETEPIFLDEELPPKKIPDKLKDKVVEETPLEETTATENNWTLKIQMTEATIERLNKELDQLENKLQNLTVKASIAGYITKRRITDGSTVLAGDSLFEIVTLNPVTLSFTVPQEVSSYVDKLVKVKASPVSAPELVFDGRVFFISPSINQSTKTLEMRVHVPNEAGLIKEGQEGTAAVFTRKINKVLVVPKKTIIKEKNRHYIYIVTGQQAEKVEVAKGNEIDVNHLTIDANIRVDDLIILTGLEQLKDGSFVRAIGTEPTPIKTNPTQPPQKPST